MKKILLGTSALIGAAALLAGSAYADDPKVTIGGFSTFEAGWAHSDFTDNTGTAATPAKNHAVAFRNDNEIHFNVAGKSDAGLGYGAEIDLQADINGSQASTAGSSNSGIVARRTYGWLQGDQWGHIEYGSNDGAARNLKVDASNIARATGGIDGDFIFFANVNSAGGGQASTGAFTGGNTAGRAANGSANNYITAPRLPVENGPANGFATDVWGNDTKITYYTPRFSGFQLGVSYIPELTNRGQLDSTAVVNQGGGVGASNIWEGGLNYENQFDQVGVAAALTGEAGKSDNAGNVLTGNLENLQAWNGGAKVSYMGFSVAGSYGDWNDSFASNGTDAQYWTGGLAYETGPVGASVTYLGSKTSFAQSTDNKFQDVSVGVDYKLAPGLTPFIEYTWYDIDPSATGAGAAQENKGNVVIVGSQLSF